MLGQDFIRKPRIAIETQSNSLRNSTVNGDGASAEPQRSLCARFRVPVGIRLPLFKRAFHLFSLFISFLERAQ